eukprot:scaffold107725_cov30-Phaeocystis_antarctica.AAC.1
MPASATASAAAAFALGAAASAGSRSRGRVTCAAPVSQPVSQSVSPSYHTPSRKHMALTSQGAADISPARRTGAPSRAWWAHAAQTAWAAQTRPGPR